MKDHLPSPEFDRNRYERPNQNWECGWTCAGCPCRIGPSPSGECRATAECRPVLETKEGEAKGRWRCTRPKEHGGPCANGPLPDGTCACPIATCQPRRSLRNLRGRLSLGVTAFTLAVLLVGFFGPWRWQFISAGPVSSNHHGIAFANLRHSRPASDGCAACHVAAHGDVHEWFQAAFRAHPGPLQPHHLPNVNSTAMTDLDHACLACHPAHRFHQPNVTRDHSCSACHREHQGAGRMPAPADSECRSCHGDAATMSAAALKGARLPAAAFAYRETANRHFFTTPRPELGYTKVFNSFADHPEFQIHTQHLKDTNSLRFNHALHLSDLVKRDGRALTCAACHQPDAANALFQPVKFEAHCAACHALQFDAANPSLRVPHGAPAGVRAYLRSLPTQYADLSRRTGRTTQADTEKFVAEQMRQFRERVFAGEELEQQIFFAANPSRQITAGAGAANASPRARFAGCAYCHEVKAGGADGLPQITPVTTPDRWLVRGEFQHDKHAIVACTECHAAARSHSTADILLPTKASCATCHSPSGGVAHTCSTCHTYHSTRSAVSRQRR